MNHHLIFDLPFLTQEEVNIRKSILEVSFTDTYLWGVIIKEVLSGLTYEDIPKLVDVLLKTVSDLKRVSDLNAIQLSPAYSFKSEVTGNPEHVLLRMDLVFYLNRLFVHVKHHPYLHQMQLKIPNLVNRLHFDSTHYVENQPSFLNGYLTP